MNYELAKQLKDAGFPQGTPHKGGYWLPDPNDNHTTEPDNIRNTSTKTLEGAKMLPSYMFQDSLWSPSLSELIEACGEGFFLLEQEPHPWRQSRLWRAEAWKDATNDNNSDVFSAGGPTPEEAVARLWLSLNKK